MNEHTPGPWNVDTYGDVQANGEDVARIATCDARASADAHLIAAAPELLEACSQALVHIEGDESTHGRKFSAGNAIRAAIAKALHMPPNMK